nr:MAG TPA: Protein of unknown function (DUF1595) [Bacteriophage sp.]
MDYIRSIRKDNETNEELIKRVLNDKVCFAIIASLTPNINCTTLKALLSDPEFLYKL